MARLLSSSVSLTTMDVRNGYEAYYACSGQMHMPGFHCHDFYEFYIHIRGGRHYGLDDSLYMLEPNQLFVIPPFSMHGISSTQSVGGYERAYLNLPPETLKTLGCGLIDLDQFFRSYTAQGKYTFQLSQEDARRCVHWIDQLQQNRETNDALQDFQHYAILMDLLSVICQTMRDSQTVSSPVISNSVIQELLTYINGSYTQPLRIDALAKRFGISVSYLSHEFIKFTNHSVYDYILYRRIMLARQMMPSDMSLNTIAYQCGFNDYSNFLRMFNKLMGTSPSAYRKNLRRFQQEQTAERQR